MIYAPVIIPTLNRHEHLKRLLNSLALNTDAEKTSVIVSVDYPPAEKYVPGYQQVKKLLTNYDKSAFKELIVIFQDKNLGPFANFDFLVQYIKDHGYERYISTEDDNEFAPNFLLYMNQGLEIFEDNDRILKICAAKDVDYVSQGNVLYHKMMPAYGIGAWAKKDQLIFAGGKEVLFAKHTIRELLHFSIKSPLLFKYYVKDVLIKRQSMFKNEDGSLNWVDSLWSIYMFLTDKLCVIPVKAKARTWGNDGSGAHMPENLDMQNFMQELDTDTSFTYLLPEHMEVSDINYYLGRKCLARYIKKTSCVVGWIYYLWYLLTSPKMI